ncbi:MAG TPA: nucleotide disphospho-sugar-binding domain-containing protein [Flavisolibacter sp.]|nr:nucleotide disphospho-sugar-binding domain-containing protein [Flavisolibacter sp.]
MSYSSQIRPGTKILFANFPGDGHFNPLTGLAKHLKTIGCDVRWYTSKKYEEKISKLGIPFYGLRKAKDLGATTDIDVLFPDRKNHKSQVAKLKYDMIHVFILRGPEYFEDLQEIYEEFEFELMVADITFGAIPFVKEKMGIPVIGVDVIPLPETSKDLPPAGLGLTPSSSFTGKLKQNILRFIADRILFAQPTKVMHDVLAGYGIHSEGSNIFDIMIKKSTLVLQSGTPGFEYKRSDMSPHIHFVGPLLPYSKKKEGERWFHEKLRQYDKIILVTQGTVEQDAEKLLIPTLEAFKNSDCLVIVTTGGTGTTELREKYPHENIIIEDFIPFDDVMAYADVYVTNGGYGGVLLSIQHALPMVVAGVHEGKNEINARVGYFEVGINLKTEKPSVLQLRKAVEEVISNVTYSKKVRKLSEEFKQFDTLQLFESHVARLLKKQKRGTIARKTIEEPIY